MPVPVCLIHTLPALIPLFDGLAPPSLRLWHILDEPLLERIRARGAAAPEDIGRLADHVRLATEAGAAGVLVTCSALSGCVDSLPEPMRTHVVKIDEPMFQQAVRRGGRLLALATNPATLEPTRRSLLAAGAAGPEVRLIEGAFDAYRRGDFDTHDRLVLRALTGVGPEAEVIVLAQASMARVVRLLPESLREKVLSSPHLAMARLAERVSPSGG